jgi:charged multivesicular body protein 1
MGNDVSVEDRLYELKFTSKQLTRESAKMEKKEKEERKKIKMAIEKGNMDGARIYAENAIRNKNQALNFLRLAGRVEAVANRVETAVRMQQVTKSMAGVVTGMDEALKNMDLEKISHLMDRFEKTFEDLDVQAQTMEQSMSSAGAVSTPIDQVDSLIQQVATEHGLEVTERLDGMAVPQHAAPAKEQDDLTARLERLKAK